MVAQITSARVYDNSNQQWNEMYLDVFFNPYHIPSPCMTMIINYDAHWKIKTNHHECFLQAWKLLADVLSVLSNCNTPERVISAVIICRYLNEFRLINQKDVKQSLSKVISIFFVSITNDCRCLEYDVIKKIFYAER